MEKKFDWHIFKRKLSKSFLIMKILSLLILFNANIINAVPMVQDSKVSLEFYNANLEEIISEIKKQTGLIFLYSSDDVEHVKKINISVENEHVEDVLKKCLKDTKLNYVLDDHSITLRKKAVKALQPSKKKIKVKGKVVDSDKTPLPGVAVMLKGTSKGISTNIDGLFEIEVEDVENSVLIFKFIGMKTKEVKLNGRVDISVLLESDSEMLGEIVVSTGYQKIDRKLFTGAAASLSAKDAKVDGVSDVGKMLEGKVAGVSVQSVSGTFGAAPKIRIRGASSIYGDTKPLWVVDGVVLEDVVDVSPDQLSSGDAATLISSSVAGLNADDIEKFELLKDASATALYGARAMNGVINITTKKGKAGKNRINVTSEFTVKLKPSYSQYDIMNSQEQMSMFMDMRDKGWLNHADVMSKKDGGVFYKMYDKINTYTKGDESGKGVYSLYNSPEARAQFLKRYEYANTDWFDILFKNSLQQNHSVSFSGGSKKSRFYASTSLLTDEGWTVADKVDRYTLNMNADFDINDKLRIGIQSKGSIREQRVPGAFNRTSDIVNGNYSREFDINPFSYALNTSRTISPYNEKGDYEYVRMNLSPFNILNEFKNNFIELDVLDFNIQTNISYKFNKYFDYKFTGSMRYVKTTNEHKIKENSNIVGAYRAGVNDATLAKLNKYLYINPENPNSSPVGILPKGGLYNKVDNKLVNYYFRNILSYNQIFAEDHIVNALFGQELKYVDRKNSAFDGYGYQYGRGGLVSTDPNAIKSVTQSGFSYFGMQNYYDRYVAAFTNMGYSYKGKYVFNGTVRIDGSNKLGEATSARYLPTWNVSGKWNMMEEEFMKNVSWISALNLRATYGLTASMGRATNSKVILMSETSTAPFVSERQTALRIASNENSKLTWEKQYETNIGVDLGLFNNTVSILLDAYQRNGFDLIAAVRTSGIGGETWKFANYADMKSHGVEFTLNTKNIQLKDFKWATNMTFAYNKNEITNLKAKPMIYDLVKAEGGAIQGGPVRGLYSIPFSHIGDNGLPYFFDKDGNTTMNVFFQDKDISHLKYEGPIDPKYTGGISNEFLYKGWRLNVFCTYQFGNVIRLYPSFHATYSDLDAVTKDMNNRWMYKGDEKKTNIPTIVSKRTYHKYGRKIEATYNAYNYSDIRVAKGDFIRLKEISLSYMIPKKLVSRFGLTNATLKAQATNLMLLYSDSKLNGQDPEFFGSGGVALPVPKQLTFTLKLGF